MMDVALEGENFEYVLLFRNESVSHKVYFKQGCGKKAEQRALRLSD